MAILFCRDIVLSRYSSVAMSFVHQTISRNAAHVAVSFVSRYSSLTSEGGEERKIERKRERERERERDV